MKISIDWVGSYLEHKIFFDELARAMQAAGHKVGIVTGEREIDPFTGADKRKQILESLNFTPDFMYLWGANESIANGNLWKCQKLDQEDILIHFDDDAAEMKRYTGRWIIKTLNSSEIKKF